MHNGAALAADGFAGVLQGGDDGLAAGLGVAITIRK